MKKENSENYISLSQATELCIYTQEYLSLRARQGKLRAVKFGRNWVTTKDWLAEYCEHNGIGNGTSTPDAATSEVDALTSEVKATSGVINPPEDLPIGELVAYKPKLLDWLVIKKPVSSVLLTALTISLIFAAGVFGKESIAGVYDDVAPVAQKMQSDFQEGIAITDKKIDDKLSYYTESFNDAAIAAVAEVGRQTISVDGQEITVEATVAGISNIWQGYGDWASQEILVAWKKVKESPAAKEIARADQFLEKVFSDILGPIEDSYFAFSKKAGDVIYPAVQEIFQNFSRANDAAGKIITDVSGEVGDRYVSADNFLNEKVGRILEIIAGPFRLAYQFVSSPWGEKVERVGLAPGVPLEELDELRADLEQLKREPVVVKRVEVSRIVEPVKEVTKTIETEKIITKVDDSALAQIRNSIAFLEEEMTNRLYAPGGVISQTIRVTEPVQSPKIYQENGEIVLQTLGSGNVILSAATGLQLYGQQVIIESTNTLNPLIYLASKTRIGGDTTITGTANVGGGLGVGGDISTQGNLTVTGNISVSGTQTFSGVTAITASSTSPILTLTQTGSGDILNLFDDTTEVFSVLDGGNIGIASSTPSNTLAVQGTIMGSGDVIFYGATATTTIAGGLAVDTSTLFVDPYNNRVGIATTTPRYKLDVWGDMAVGTSTAISDTAIIAPAFYVTSKDRPQIGIGTSTVGSNLLTVGTTTPAFVVDARGNVGIGTTEPSQKLHILGNNPILKIEDGGTNSLTLQAHSSSGAIVSGTALTFREPSNTYGMTFQTGVTPATKLTLGGTANGDINFYQGTGKVIFNGTGNVGIATTTPRYTLDVWGDMAVGTSTAISGTATIAPAFYVTSRDRPQIGIGTSTVGSNLLTVGTSTPAFVVFPDGGVGVATTTASGFAFAVQGQCVTGDTRLRRRRKRKERLGKTPDVSPLTSGVEESRDGYLYDEVMIKNIKPGDEIASLDEKTGKIVWSKVKGLMDMGVQPIYELVTESGKKIRTTGNHPYLTKVSQPENSLNKKPKVGVFIDDANMFYAQRKAGWRVDYGKLREFLSKDFDVQFINYYIAVPAETDQPAFYKTQQYFEKLKGAVNIIVKPLKYISETIIADDGKIVIKRVNKKGDVDVDIAIDVVNNLCDLDTVVIFSGDSDFVKLRNDILTKGKKVVFIAHNNALSIELRQGKFVTMQKIRPFIELGTTNKKAPETARGILLSLLYSGQESLSRGPAAWTKAAYLSKGDEIAVMDASGRKSIFEKITAINKKAKEQVYDIEVEGTHNFIGNDIVAHNTYMSATTTIANGLKVGGNKLYVSENGNVGIGTTGPASKLQVAGGDITIDNSSFYYMKSTDNINNGYLQMTGGNSVILRNPRASSDVYIEAAGNINFADASDSIKMMVNISTGNVGIATTTPRYKLDVWGDMAVGTSTAISDTSTIAPAFYVTSKDRPQIGIGTSTVGSNLLTVGTSTPALVVAANGNVGIGTTGPTAVVDVISASGVAKVFRVKQFSSAAYDGNYNFEFQGGMVAGTNNGMLIRYNENDAARDILVLSNSSGPTVTFESTGNVGIATTTPRYKLDVWGDMAVGTSTAISDTAIIAPAFYVTSKDRPQIGIGTSTVGSNLLTVGTTTPAFVVDARGNVGIGTTAPSSKLEVVGDGKFTGTGYQTLEVESTGAGNWAQLMVDSNTAQVVMAAGTISGEARGQILMNTNHPLDISGYGNAGFIRITNTGNLGIATTTPRYKLDVWGDMAVGTSTAISDTSTIAPAFYVTSKDRPQIGIGTSTVGSNLLTVGTSTPAFVVFPDGGVGVATTTASGFAFAVQGQCVTGDTKLRRRRKRKERLGETPDVDGEYLYDEVMIKDIKPGDEIASLDEKTGKIVWSRVNALLDMGIKPIYKLITESGRTIRTTGNHPYLAREALAQESFKQISTKFEVDQSNRIEELNRDTYLAIANQELSYAIKLPAKEKKALYAWHQEKRPYRRFIGWQYFAKALVWAIRASDFRITDLVIDFEYPGYEQVIAGLLKEYLPGMDVSFKAIGKHSPAHSVAYLANKEGKAVQKVLSFEQIKKTETPDGAKGLLHRGVVTADSQSIRSRVSILADQKSLSRARWTKVFRLREGQQIAVAHDGAAIWDKIISIQRLPAEQVYDIEVEGTHNFIGNDIVAHNTYMSATTTIANGLKVGGNKLYVSENGNVGIGTATPEAKLEVAGLIYSTTSGFQATYANPNLRLNDTAGNAYDIQSTGGRLKFIFGDTSTPVGYLSTTGLYVGNQLTRYISDDGTNIKLNGQTSITGNVGIATTTPRYTLDVWGDMAVGTSTAISDTATIAPAFYVTSKDRPQIGIGTSTVGSALLTVGTTTPALVVDARGNVGIGTTGPSYKLDVSGTGRFTGNVDVQGGLDITGGSLDIGSNAITSIAGSGTLTGDANRLVIRTGVNLLQFEVATADVAKMVINNSGNVGIATTTPRYKLDVWGDMAVGTSTAISDTATIAPAFYVTSKDRPQIGIGTTTVGSNLLTVGTSTPAFVVDARGNVGIGTATPGYKLEVNGGTVYFSDNIIADSFVSNNLYSVYNAGDNSIGMVLDNTPGADKVIQFQTRNAANDAYLPRLTFSNRADTANVYFQNSNVGIGTTGPSSKLTVFGGDLAVGDGVATSTILNGSISLDYGLTAATSTFTATSTLASINADSGLLYVDSYINRVGIATTTPRYTLDVWGDMAVGTSSGTGAPQNYPLLYVESGTDGSNGVGIGTTTVAGTMLTVGTTTPAFVVTSTGNIGIGTKEPATSLDIYDSSDSQMRLTQTSGSQYADFKIDATGNLTITLTGDTLTIKDDNLYVCSGDACQTLSISGTGNLAVENDIEIGGDYTRTCATGYIWVPGSAKFGTLPGFCVMKYEAKNDGSGNAVSQVNGIPWVSISQETARATCQAVGVDYRLISEAEWMTLAENIANLPINDMDSDAALQLATGHTDNNPADALAATSTLGTDPIVSGCTLTANMENASNAYAAGTCEIQGDGTYDGNSGDMGFNGTGQAWSATGYSAGAANKSQLRTHVLSNGKVIWDLAGNVWEWIDQLALETEVPVDATPANEWLEYTAITAYKSYPGVRPPDDGWSSTNGIGKLYSQDGDAANTRAFIRGGYWSSGATAGVFTLNLDNSPADTSTNLGFRCAR